MRCQGGNKKHLVIEFLHEVAVEPQTIVRNERLWKHNDNEYDER